MKCKTIGELKSFLKDISDDTPIISRTDIRVVKAHFLKKDGSFITFHYGEGFNCCIQADKGYYDTDLKDGITIS